MSAAVEIAIRAAEEAEHARREEQDGRLCVLLVKSGLAAWFPETEWTIFAENVTHLVDMVNEKVDFIIEPDDGSFRLVLKRRDLIEPEVEIYLVDRPGIDGGIPAYDGRRVRSLAELGRILKVREGYARMREPVLA